MAKKKKLEDKRLRCLSVQQPWAWLICVGGKTIENRTWKTDFRGTIAIHASTSKDRVKQAERNSESGLISLKDFTFGAIIGFADIESISLYGPEHEEVGHASGPYCWKMASARLLKEPIPLPGKLNLFFLDEAISTKLASADTFVVDLSSSEKTAALAGEFEPEPDPYRWYRYCIRELLQKEAPELLLPKCNRMIELQPKSLEAYLFRIKVAKRKENEAQVAANLAQLSKILDEKYGSENDIQLRIEYEEWFQAEEVEDEEASEDESLEGDSDEAEEIEDDLESDGATIEDRFFELLNSLAFLANEYRLLEIWDASLACATRCVRLDPENLGHSFDLGLAYIGLKRFQEAIETFERVITTCNKTEADLDEDDDDWRPYALLLLATSFRQLQQFESATKAINEALSEVDDDPDYYIEAAHIAKAMGDSKLVRKYRQKALKLGAEEEEVSDFL